MYKIYKALLDFKKSKSFSMFNAILFDDDINSF